MAMSAEIDATLDLPVTSAFIDCPMNPPLVRASLEELDATDQSGCLSSGGHSPTRRVQFVKRRGALIGDTGPHQQRLRQSMPSELK
jgi:hypothetical protein